MERLHKDVLIQIAARIYYPTQLINLCLTSSAFRCLGVNEILFRMFWLRAFYKFSPDFVLKYQPPPNWTWKEVFIYLFKSKREIISRMYHYLGLTYEHSFRDKSKADEKLMYHFFSEYQFNPTLKKRDISKEDPTTRYKINSAQGFLINAKIHGVLEFNLNKRLLKINTILVSVNTFYIFLISIKDNILHFLGSVESAS